MTIRGAVEKPNSSAPKIAATTTSNLKDDKIYFSYSAKDENQYTEKNLLLLQSQYHGRNYEN